MTGFADKSVKNKKIFYGTTIIGEKGQVVVPIEARKRLNLKKGERLLVFGMGGDMVALIKLSRVEKIAQHLSEKLKTIDKIINRHKK